MNAAIKKVLLFNPPGPLYQRGEDRCQANVEASAAVSLRAPNDLAYMAAMLRRQGIEPKIRDFPAEQGTWADYESELRSFSPDAVVLSVTNATILEDMKAFIIAKSALPDVVTIAKGAVFFSADPSLFEKNEFDGMDFALVGESEWGLSELIGGLSDGKSFAEIPAIFYRGKDRRWFRTPHGGFEPDPDSLPFPARDLLRNELYVRPDTGAPQATIQTARGCPSKCIFCMTPAISGEKVRSRSPKNIVDELEECVTRYGIRDFFFKADTFTINKKFVIELCREILDRKLDIAWAANSRVDTIDEERLDWMKRAGCWLVAFGYESGNDTILKQMKKEATVEDAYRATRLVKNAGLRVYGFFMIGLPWDTHETVRETLSFARKLACDFYEIHLATPYEGTELYSTVRELGLLKESSLGHNYFNDPAIGSLFLSREEILDYRKKGLRQLYLSPSFIAKTVTRLHSPGEFLNYARYGSRLIKNLFS